MAAAILQSTLRKQLRISLEGMDGREQVCQLSCESGVVKLLM